MIDVKEEDLEEILDHPYIENPRLLLQTYPGLLEIYWRYYETLFQYKGHTCMVAFFWRLLGAEILVCNVKVFKIRKAPLEQHE